MEFPSRKEVRQATEQEKLKPTLGFIPTQHLFAAISVVFLAAFRWPLRWLFSGAPILTYSILIGAARGYRILPFLPLWPLIAGINLVYSVAATSWLLYWFFLGLCYPAIFLSCLFQFDGVATFVRRRLRKLLKELQFTNDVIAFFDLPALEIDVDVEGLMCIRGMTFSFSSLTIVAHGVEVGIKFSADMEMALATDKVEIKLFRSIHVSDVYGNVKGGEYEMTFGKLAKKSKDKNGESVMVTDTPLLAAAAAYGDTTSLNTITTTERMTGGAKPVDASVKSGLQSASHISPDDEEAGHRYQTILNHIAETSVIRVSQMEAEEAIRDKEEVSNDVLDNNQDMRAAICSQLHDKPSIPHPATRSIKVSTIKNLTPPRTRKFLHRLPLLLRLLLNPLSYFHPVYINSITAGGSGRWLEHMLHEMVFKDYAEQDKDIRKLKQRISAWLADANFLFEATKITGLATVPINSAYDIISHLTFDDIMAYRTMPKEVDLQQIVRLGGADARLSVPSFLLPHHEHLLPPYPDKQDMRAQQKRVEEADGMPKTIQEQNELDQMKKDETNITISTHVRLPACFDQSLLDFIAALVKATKMIEFEKTESPLDKEVHGFRDFTKALNTHMKDGMRKAVVDAAANDKWIAKLVGKITKKLETVQGDVGYSGGFPVPLDVYRKNAEPESKLMP